jgi:hypothetical protein
VLIEIRLEYLIEIEPSKARGKRFTEIDEAVEIPAALVSVFTASDGKKVQPVIQFVTVHTFRQLAAPKYLKFREELLRALHEPRILYPSRDPFDRAAVAEAEFAARTLGHDFAKHLWKALDVAHEPRGAGGLTQGYSELYYVSIATGTIGSASRFTGMATSDHSPMW